MIQFRTLQKKDIPSLLQLYIQLDPVNDFLEVEEAQDIWEKISKNENIKYFVAVDDAKENNCYMVCLLSNTKRTEAHKFYEKIGFKGDTKKGFVMKFE